MKCKIPKIIHYCWFGSNEMPKALKECVESWKKYMPEYEIRECNESMCSFDENGFVKKAYAEKRWAYVSDYYRLRMLYEYGGIYLDTDVRVRKSFDPLLEEKCFLNFLNDCVVGSAVIGAEPHSKLIGDLLNLYENAVFGETHNDAMIDIINGQAVFSEFDTNNFLFTYYLIQKYPELKLNNRCQKLEDFIIFPKQMFETGSILNNHYSIHLGTGSWKKGIKSFDKQEQHGALFEYLRVIKRNIQSKKKNKEYWFYNHKVNK